MKQWNSDNFKVNYSYAYPIIVLQNTHITGCKTISNLRKVICYSIDLEGMTCKITTTLKQQPTKKNIHWKGPKTFKRKSVCAK